LGGIRNGIDASEGREREGSGVSESGDQGTGALITVFFVAGGFIRGGGRGMMVAVVVMMAVAALMMICRGEVVMFELTEELMAVTAEDGKEGDQGQEAGLAICEHRDG
jgi:hypothetical protein